MTVFAHMPGLFSFVLAIPVLFLVSRPSRDQYSPPLPSNSPVTPYFRDLPEQVRREDDHSSSVEGPQAKAKATSIRPLPALTTYRAHMMLMTVLAILAVDFPVFPRELAKCETFGVSLVCPTFTCLIESLNIISCRWIWVWDRLCSRKASCRQFLC
jgi:glucosaminylphosphatidylinositol acyltransferase